MDETSNTRLDPEMVNRIEDQHRANIKKWGHQNPVVLQAVLMEEIGEVSQAFLQSHFGYEDCDTDDLETEIVDAMAVLAELYQNIDKWNYAKGNDGDN